jgi:hypothetical protein
VEGARTGINLVRGVPRWLSLSNHLKELHSTTATHYLVVQPVLYRGSIASTSLKWPEMRLNQAFAFVSLRHNSRTSSGRLEAS